jgi:predicted RNA-binding Zn-ribbon protein involved in translation (DUF1610 family)
MSLPAGDAEWRRYNQTAALAGPAENIVSTACPDCGVRFVMLATLRADGWFLRCANCDARRMGELKQVQI